MILFLLFSFLGGLISYIFCLSLEPIGYKWSFWSRGLVQHWRCRLDSTSSCHGAKSPVWRDDCSWRACKGYNSPIYRFRLSLVSPFSECIYFLHRSVLRHSFNDSHSVIELTVWSLMLHTGNLVCAIIVYLFLLTLAISFVGENVEPAEIEEAASRSTLINQIVVIGQVSDTVIVATQMRPLYMCWQISFFSMQLG